MSRKPLRSVSKIIRKETQNIISNVNIPPSIIEATIEVFMGQETIVEGFNRDRYFPKVRDRLKEVPQSMETKSLGPQCGKTGSLLTSGLTALYLHLLCQ